MSMAAEISVLLAAGRLEVALEASPIGFPLLIHAFEIMFTASATTETGASLSLGVPTTVSASVPTLVPPRVPAFTPGEFKLPTM